MPVDDSVFRCVKVTFRYDTEWSSSCHVQHPAIGTPFSAGKFSFTFVRELLLRPSVMNYSVGASLVDRMDSTRIIRHRIVTRVTHTRK